ncbi:unnamed protein product [Closterium sp. Naga37s-1]|nr:unnamed protein product [Closterium sp. Naga37s-1]
MLVRNLKKDLEEMTQQRSREKEGRAGGVRGGIKVPMAGHQYPCLIVFLHTPQVLRGCIAELNQVPAVGVPQLVSAIKAHIQPEVEQEGEDLVLETAMAESSKGLAVMEDIAMKRQQSRKREDDDFNHLLDEFRLQLSNQSSEIKLLHETVLALREEKGKLEARVEGFVMMEVKLKEREKEVELLQARAEEAEKSKERVIECERLLADGANEIATLKAKVQEHAEISQRHKAEMDGYKARVKSYQKEVEKLQEEARVAEKFEMLVTEELPLEMERALSRARERGREEREEGEREAERNVVDLTELDEITEQRNGLRQQLRNTQEHKARLQQELMEAGDNAMKALRDYVGALSKVRVNGVSHLVSAIKRHIQPVVEQEEEDLVEVNPDPKLVLSTRLLVRTINTLLAAATKA